MAKRNSASASATTEQGLAFEVLSGEGRKGHFGLHGLRESAGLIGRKLVLWSEVASGTEVDLNIPASKAYTEFPRLFWFSRSFAQKVQI